MIDRSPTLLYCACGALFAISLQMSACLAAQRNALRRIVQEQCVVHWSQQHDARPCARIALPEPPHERDGFAILADRKGGAHFLLIPVKTVAGMESPELLEPGTPNYFAAAWEARDLLPGAAGRPIRRGDVGLALNPRHARTQDQFHIHIECLRPDIARALELAAPRIGGSWAPMSIDGRRTRALRVMGGDLDGADPIALLAAGVPEARAAMGDYTLVVAGMEFKEGPGFILLAADGPAGELLLDPTCAIAATP